MDIFDEKAEKLIFSPHSLIPKNWRMFGPKSAQDYRAMMQDKLEKSSDLTQMNRSEILAILRTRTVSEISHDPNAKPDERSSAYLAFNEALNNKWVTPAQLKCINKDFLMQEAELGVYKGHIKPLDELYEITQLLNRISAYEQQVRAPSAAEIKESMDFCKGRLAEMQASGKLMSLIGKPFYAEGADHLPACIAQVDFGDNACFTRIHGPYILVREMNKFYLGYLLNPNENTPNASFVALHEPIHLSRENINAMALATDCMEQIVVAQLSTRLVTGMEHPKIHQRGAQMDVFIPLEDNNVLSLSRVEAGQGNCVIKGRVLGDPTSTGDISSNLQFARTFYARYLFNDPKLCKSVMFDCNPKGFKPMDAYSFTAQLKKLPSVSMVSTHNLPYLLSELNKQKERDIVVPNRASNGRVLSAKEEADMKEAQSFSLITTKGHELARFSEPESLWSALTSNESDLGLNEGDVVKKWQILQSEIDLEVMEVFSGGNMDM
jgi:hypothetical protein